MSDQLTFDQWAQNKIEKIDELSKTNENPDQGVWFNILKQIITAADVRTTTTAPTSEEKVEPGDCIYADYADDNESFQASDIKDQFSTKTVKWTLRVKAFQLVHRLVPTLESSHLSDLVRLSFVSATSPYDELKLEGFKMFEYIINRFASVEEKGFPGHSIIEQYKTQVISAINPALDLEAPPYITAIASRLLCLWICRNLETESAGLKRVYQLTLKTLSKLENQSTNQNSKLYTESELEQERLEILGSWALIYVKSKESRNLGNLIKPQVRSLIDKWWEALKDYALLIIPKSTNSYNVVLTASMTMNEPVYTRQVALGLFANIWYKLILAVSHWLHYDIHETTSDPMKEQTPCDKYYKFICGIMMKEFCSHSKEHLTEPTKICIKSLILLLQDEQIKVMLATDDKLTQELYIVLYSILIGLARGTQTTQIIHCLESLFRIYVEAVMKQNQDEIRPIMKKIGGSIKRNLEELNSTIGLSSSEEVEKDIIRINIKLRISNLICICKMLGENDTADGMKEELILTLRYIISFRKDTTIRNTLLQILSELNYGTDEDHLNFIREGLYASKIDALSEYLSADPIATATISKTEIENLMKSLIGDIKVKKDDISMEILEKLLLRLVEKPTDDNPIKESGVKSDHRFGLIQLLKLHLPELFERCMQKNSDLNDTYVKIIDLNREHKMATEQALHGDEQSKKSQQNNSNLSTKSNSKPRAKIVLKTDFGNFYENKPSK